MKVTIHLSREESRNLIVDALMNHIYEDFDAQDDERSSLEIVKSRDDAYLAATLRKILLEADPNILATVLQTSGPVS